MGPVSIIISDETFAKMKEFAEPLVDTHDTVISRALEALVASSHTGTGTGDPSVRILNPFAPPDLSYTNVHSITFAGNRFPKAETYWNHLLIAVIRATRKSLTTDQVSDLILCNHIVGKKEDSGFKWLEDVGVSVQGQDANSAWRTITNILAKKHSPLEVDFSWQDNAKAAFPGQRAKFQIGVYSEKS